ncbi:MAG: DUF6165 family protein [Gammaproteobacteria bacterium]
MSINIELSVGELLDKVTILQIKSERISDQAKLENINKELRVLTVLWEASAYSQTDLKENIQALKDVNEALWDIEDKIRDKERDQSFDQEFIELARSVYFTNDKRAEIKKVINTKTGSELVEEKSYKQY